MSKQIRIIENDEEVYHGDEGVIKIKLPLTQEELEKIINEKRKTTE